MTRTSRLILPMAMALMCAVLAGCNGTIASLEPALSVDDTEERSTAEGRKMIGKPYRVGGRWYHPKEDKNYDKQGLASWYGPKFHGRKTANGERFNQNALTAAHPTLPLPSYVRVTMVRSGKSAVLRINDRGPFKKGRIIDVSKAAAEELGFKNAGHAKVRVEYLGPAPVGGSDRETKIAAKKFGTVKKPLNTEAEGKSRSMRNLFAFGRKKEAEDDGNIEVRLAARDEPKTESDPLPGVAKRYTERPQEPVKTAYADDDDKNGAIEAVIAMAPPPEDPAKKIAAQPLPETATNVSANRVFGAHDLFATTDSSGVSTSRGEDVAQVAPAQEEAVTPR
ncbi:MAG: septal ring lytic transglycosylase RlpA family protein [Pseudomonadota bacterium]